MLNTFTCHEKSLVRIAYGSFNQTIYNNCLRAITTTSNLIGTNRRLTESYCS